ncbi:homoserine acetyltransferase [Bradyrhizobium sp. i1.8.4]
MIRLCAALLAALVSMSVPVMAADYPAPQDGEWIAKDFKFHSGEVMPELRLHYTTVGAPTGQPVLCCTAPAARPPAC